MKYFLLVLSLVGLYSCVSAPVSEGGYGYYPVAGSKIIINSPLEVTENRAGIYIQGGQNTQGAHSRFAPFCYIRYRNVSQSSRMIQADTFVVKSSRIETRLIVNHKPTSPRFRLVSRGYHDSAPSDVVEVVKMRIYSEKQPSVYLLECGGVEDHPAEVEPPSVPDIHRAMGNLMTLKLRLE